MLLKETRNIIYVANREYYLMRSSSEISNDTLSVPESLRESEQSANLWYVANREKDTN